MTAALAPAPALRPDRVATALVARLAREVAGPDRAPVRRALVAARRTRLLLGDPSVAYDLDGTPVLLPLSHDLPVHRARHPRYSQNLGRVAEVVGRADPGATMVDVGANVGDSVAIVRARSTLPVLCVEGDEVFLPYLRHNLAGVADVEVAPHYVSVSPDGAAGVQVTRAGGTARIVEGKGEGGGATRPLAALVAEHPRFARPRLLKVDTDGHDAAILTAALPLVATTRPVLFFEHDPVLARAVGADDPVALFGPLVEAGYAAFLVLANTGPLLGVHRADDVEALAARCRVLGTDPDLPYVDLCAVHADDAGRIDELVAALS